MRMNIFTVEDAFGVNSIFVRICIRISDEDIIKTGQKHVSCILKILILIYTLYAKRSRGKKQNKHESSEHQDT